MQTGSAHYKLPLLDSEIFFHIFVLYLVFHLLMHHHELVFHIAVLPLLPSM